MNISLELYKTFYYVAKNQSISRAANELMISQPAISKSIKTLEEQLNTTLFIRKRDGVYLTEAGEVIYKKIKNSMELIKSAEQDLISLTNMEYGVINIGASKTILNEFLLPHISNYHNEHPNIKIRIHTDNLSELIKKTKAGLIDVLFSSPPFNITNDFEIYRLIDLHHCLAANNKFIHLKNKKLNITDLEKLPLLLLTKGLKNRIRFDNFCTENNITVNAEMEFGSNTLIKDFTLAGFGVGLLNEEHIKDELEKEELFKLDIDLKIEEKYLVMVYEKDTNSITTQNFINYIKNNITSK